MILLYDNIAEGQITVDATKRTADGYLAASARVARTGIQIYTGRECGRPDLEFVRVYRPESEVFKADAMKTFAHRPITDDHPHTQVTADNWKQLSKGHTADEVVRDGKFIRVPMLLMDGPTIKKWEDGKRELSMGYACDLAWEDGITPDGEEYDAIQRNIRANHLALVKKARGGEDLHIGDATMKTCPECSTMMPKTAKECPDCHYEMVTDAGNPYHDPKNGQFTHAIHGTEEEKQQIIKKKKGYIGKKAIVHEVTVQHKEGGVKTRLPPVKHLTGNEAVKKAEHDYPEHKAIHLRTRLVPDENYDSAADDLTADDLDTEVGNNGEPTMKIMVDGISLEMADKDAQIVQRALDAAKDEIFKSKKKMEEMMSEEEKAKKKYETDAAALTTQVATLTTENTQLKKQVADTALTPAKLDALVKDRSITLDKAKAILGADKVDAKLTDAEIRRACVNHVVGDAAKDWSDDLINASFATIKTQPSDGVRKLANSFDSQPQSQNTSVLDTAHSNYEKHLREASQQKSAA